MSADRPSMFQRFWRSVRDDLPLRGKLLLLFFFLIVVPLVFLALVSSQTAAGLVEERSTHSAQQAFEQAGAFLEYKLQNVRRIANVVALDRRTNEILTKSLNGYGLSDQLKDRDDLITSLFALQDGINVYRLRVFVRNGLFYSEEHVNLFEIDDALKTLWYRRMVTENLKSLWCSDRFLQPDPLPVPVVLSLARVIPDLNDYGLMAGLVRVDFLKSTIENILKNSNVVPGGSTFLYDSKGGIVASNDDELTKKNLVFLPDLPGDEVLSMRPVTVTAREALVWSRGLANTDWRLITIVPKLAILSESNRTRNQVLVTILSITLVVFLLANWLSWSITRRLSLVTNQMRSVEHGSLEKIHGEIGKDEIGELTGTYNFMVARILTLIEQEAAIRHSLKDAELQALQAQINPHFLYNTLDMIRWMAHQGQIEGVEAATQSLADFYRITLSRGASFIPLAEELKQVKLYLRIQNLRLRGAIKVKFDVDPSLLDVPIFKLTLQPLVENAILHGIAEKPTKAGTVSIRAALEGDEVVLRVVDDGVGIDADRLRLLQEHSESMNSGFGLKNIHERFQLQFGDRAGLQVESTLGAGTTVTLRFPLVLSTTRV